MFAYLPNTATFVCYMAPFPLDMSHAMPSHCPPSEPTSDDGNSPPRRKVRGKGRGGAGAKYCTMGPGKRKEQFPGHPLSLRTNDLGIEVLWCDACGCPVSHTTKSTVQCHLDSKKHQVAVETMQKREKARVERRLEAEADALPHKAAMRQPSLQSVVASCNDKNKAADDTVFAFAGAGIPLDKHVLQHVWRNARWFLCWSHKLAGIGDILRKHDVFSMINLLYRSSSLVKVPMHSARRRRWRERSGLETVPPNIGDTRWTSWRDGADWYCENWEAWKDFVVLDAGKTKRNEENLSLMHEIHDCITKQGVNCVVRLAFITDHTSVLMAAINLAQSDGPVACFVYDKMKDVQFHWEDTLQRKILHPRIEEALKKLPRSADSIRRKLFDVMEEMLNALKNRFEKEAEQLEFFQQLRVLNPRNLSDMDTNLSSYKSLKLDEVPGVQEEWNLYRRTEFRNINNGDELLAWWESRPDSLFKEAVLFLITIPTSSGAVERFFSQAGNVSKKQNKLLNQMRRLAFMARFNLDVEGRLV